MGGGVYLNAHRALPSGGLSCNSVGMKSLPDVIAEAIAHHRAEIARLERALAAYAGPALVVAPASARARVTDEAKQRTRVSKYESLFQTFASIGRPLTNDDMIRIAADHGHQIDRGNLRSIVHNQKILGRVNPVADGYLWNMETTSSSFPSGEEGTGGLGPPANFTPTTAGKIEGGTGGTDAPGEGGI